MSKIWYAVMLGDDDYDWTYGCYDKDEAIEMAKCLQALGDTEAYIAMIDYTPPIYDPICIGRIDIEER